MSLQRKKSDTKTFTIESAPPRFDSFYHIIPTGTKGKLLIIDIGETANCWLYHENKYKIIGQAPKLVNDWHTDLKIAKIDLLSTDDFITFFAFTTEQFDHCYRVIFDNITHKIQWTELGNNLADIDSTHYFNWQFYCVESVIAQFSEHLLLIVPGYKDEFNDCPKSTKSMFCVDLLGLLRSRSLYKMFSLPNILEIENVLPFEICHPKLVNITRYGEIIDNEYLLFAANKKMHCSHSEKNVHVAFKINIRNGNFHNLEAVQIETCCQKRQRGMCTFDYFLFNDYLIGFDRGTGRQYNECHIFSFRKMKWIAYFTIDLVWQQTKIIIHYGIVQIYAHPDWRLRNPNEIGLKHYSFDIGNAFNYRNQMFYAIMNGLKRNKYVYLEDELSKFIFDFIDDGCIVKYFDKPWEIQNSFGVNRHKIWDVLESFVIDCGSIISFNHTLDFIKLLFNYVDEINIEKNNLHKPWVNSYQQLYNQ
eukprot:516317_1